jgi:hypothetical protein
MIGERTSSCPILRLWVSDLFALHQRYILFTPVDAVALAPLESLQYGVHSENTSMPIYNALYVIL